MKITIMMGISCLVFLIGLYDYPLLKNTKKKNRISYIIILLTGWVLSIILIINPNIIGPSDIVYMLFHPFSQLIGG